MTSPEAHTDPRIRTYDRQKSVVFLKTQEKFGGLSNMAGGFPLVVNRVRIRTSEALYQACRFPHMPEVQRLIIAQGSPMTAKMKSKPYRQSSRPDWERVRVKIMRWCLRVKLAQNWTKLSELLLETGDRPIVEESRRDSFWGAHPVDRHSLIGINVLGRLLMELREEVRGSHDTGKLLCVEPLPISDFLLYGEPIGHVTSSELVGSDLPWDLSSPIVFEVRERPTQGYLFGSPALAPSEGEAPAAGNRHYSVHDFKPYPSYKDSGVPWLGEIPAHWEVRRNGRLFVQRNETGFPDLPILEVSLKTGVRVRSFDDSSRKQQMSDREQYKRACRGDIAYNMMRMWQGAVGVAAVDGLVSPAYVVARTLPGTEPRYFELLFRTDAYMGEVTTYSRGIVSDRNRLYWDDFKQIASPFPPPAEQAAIIRFLDHTNRRIQRYIRAKKKLIALLNEQKQAIIHRAVTRGLDPGVRLKPSGVEWLGEVPEHWTVVRLGRLIELTTGFPFKSENFSDNEVDIRLLRGINIAPGMIRWNFVVRWPLDLSADLERYSLRAGDLVLGMDRPIINGGVRVAKVCEADAPSLLLQRVARIRPHLALDADFLLHILGGRSFADYLAPIFTGISVPHISPEQVGSFHMAVPSLTEQTEIVKALRASAQSLDLAMRTAKRELDLLLEYRTRLIANVVTGELDVREAAARLPEEIENIEPLDEDEVLAEEEGGDADAEGDDSSEEAVA
jgi:type I restriction enzyme S subunit